MTFYRSNGLTVAGALIRDITKITIEDIDLRISVARNIESIERIEAEAQCLFSESCEILEG